MKYHCLRGRLINKSINSGEKRKIIMEIIGILKEIKETQDVGSSGFQKRECVVTTDEQYPQHILVQFVQDKCNLLSNFKVGEKVTIGINLRGREWTNPQGETVYFNTIQGWKITSVQPTYQHPGTPPPAQTYPQAPANSQFNQLPTQQAANFEEENDDLPF